jgi:hypothetical protein
VTVRTGRGCGAAVSVCGEQPAAKKSVTAARMAGVAHLI